MLSFECSSYAETAGFVRPAGLQRGAAATPSGSVKAKGLDIPSASTFPAPLVLPRDDLANDPKYPAQSFRAWVREKDRNEVTTQRKTIYLCAPPTISPEVSMIASWRRANSCADLESPEIEDVKDYLAAFYYGLSVKMVPESQRPRYTTWEEPGRRPAKDKSKAKAGAPSYIGLVAGGQRTRVRTRLHSGDGGLFPRQLNLNDIIDAAMEMLPEDAYALLLLLEHDIYEDDNDDFACGRAYGGSRVAVISSARYNPHLDALQGIHREHAWPASHETVYMEELCESAAASDHKSKKRKIVKDKSSLPITVASDSSSPLYAAHKAFKSWIEPELESNPDPRILSNLWLARVCRTSSHELGHCFGIDHCVYYACCMQGTAGLIEDTRQPLYLCPVDLAKVLKVTGADRVLRYKALVGFSERFSTCTAFVAHAAWIRTRLSKLGPA